ncbi:DUF3617 domain-containing protein [Methylophaga nitratireducenticrescens]|uniref:DUF3617 domain-containing protein n=1 Tax=Methylophaga nitratireducenticrescens TaxID=754476 RepID=UPI001FD2E0DF|nr:DUF3617 family protein [Methylophaga nitratireducenticrescens]
MKNSIFLYSIFVSLTFLSAPIFAETPNLQPGLWSYTSTTNIEGPMNMPAQTNSNQECLTQTKLDEGMGAMNLHESCNVTKADIKTDRVDYAASCSIEGMTTLFEGYATFHGNRLEGKMSSDMNTPLGPMKMNTEYQGERVGDC